MTPDLSNFARIELVDGRIFEPTPDGWRVLVRNVSVHVNETLVALDLAQMLGLSPLPDLSDTPVPVLDTTVRATGAYAENVLSDGRVIGWRNELSDGGSTRLETRTMEFLTPNTTYRLTLTEIP